MQEFYHETIPVLMLAVIAGSVVVSMAIGIMFGWWICHQSARGMKPTLPQIRNKPHSINQPSLDGPPKDPKARVSL